MTLFKNISVRKTAKRAIPWGVALFFVTSLLSPAGLAKVETYQDIIEKAYTLSLQKDRTQAVHLLVNAARKESKKGQVPKELLSALDEVSSVFYSDKAQQLHELALSLRVTDPVLATQKLNEAARIEPENQEILLGQQRMQIALGECDAVLKQSRKWNDANPFSEEVKLLVAQAALCAGQFGLSQQMKTQADPKKSGLEVFWQTLDLENAFKTAAFSKGKDLGQALIKLDPAYPETHFWLWKMELGLKSSDDRPGQKYLAACKSMTSRASRKYLAEPRLCRRTAEVELELKKNTNPGRE